MNILKYRELRSNTASITFAHLLTSTNSVIISNPCVHNLTCKDKKEKKQFHILALKSSTTIKKNGRENNRNTMPRFSVVLILVSRLLLFFSVNCFNKHTICELLISGKNTD